MNRIDHDDLDRRERRDAGDGGRDGGGPAALRSVAARCAKDGRIFLVRRAPHLGARRSGVRELPHLRRLRQPGLGPRQPVRRRSRTTRTRSTCRRGGQPIFHPLKGPMTTQSLRGMANARPDALARRPHGRQRSGRRSARRGRGVQEVQSARSSACSAGASSSTLGDAGVHRLHPDGDTIRRTRSARSTTRRPRAGRRRDFLHRSPTVDASVLTVRLLPRAAVRHRRLVVDRGRDRRSSRSPHLRNLYQKIGMFGVGGRSGARLRLPARRLASSRVYNFLTAAVFDFGSPPPSRTRTAGTSRQFALAFDTGLKPIVGQQVVAHARDRRRRRR